MPSQIAKILELNQDQQESLEPSVSKLKSLAEWFNETVEALKDTPILKALGTAGEAAKEWSGTVKATGTLLEKLTKERSPQVLGWLACTLAYRQAAEDAVRQQGPPHSHLPFSADLVRDRLAKLHLEEPAIMSGFSLASSTGHPFLRAADKAFLLTLEVAGYNFAERRMLVRAARSAFTAKLQEILSGDQAEKFAPFRHYLETDTDDARLYGTLAAYADIQRADLEDHPALGVEPFAIDQVYIECECGVLPWATIRDPGPDGTRVDPFDEKSAPREDLMQAVLRLMADPSYNEAIMIEGAPGAGKSTFTKKLCAHLAESGFIPIRIPLQHLRVDREIFEAVQDVVIRFGGRSARPFKIDLLREKVFAESVPTEGRDISPYVFIFDGWDEISLSADEGFQKRIERLLDNIRQTLLDQTRNTIRVVLTGRPSQAIGQANFLRDGTIILTIRKIQPQHLQSYVTKLAQALQTPTFPGTNNESWSLGPLDRYEGILAKYKKEFPNTRTLDVLGQPLLVHLALKVMASFRGDLANLITPSTTLFRHLTDLTCKRGGKHPAEPAAAQTARIEGKDLRTLLHGTALAITAYGAESIPHDELEFRLDTLGIGSDVFPQTKKHPLPNLMISFYFKDVTEHSGCEFLHKSFREYLAAEATIEILKSYGRRAGNNLPERPEYWKDFQQDDVRFDFSRKLGEAFCSQWLSEEISSHIEELLRWEIDRAYHPEDSSHDRGILTEAISVQEWERVRDGLADLWDWWGEGVHLRVQPRQIKRDWKFDDPPLVVELVRLAMRRANYNRSTPPRSPRTATIDAHLGCALFQLNCFVHAHLSGAKGWTELARQIGANALWSPYRRRRRYQVQVEHNGIEYVQFAPSGESSVYFRNYIERINGPDVSPYRDRFPSYMTMRGVFLSGCELWAKEMRDTDLSASDLSFSSLDNADMLDAQLALADLTSANCTNAYFRSARLRGTDVQYAVFAGTDVTGADLEGIVNLSPEQRQQMLGDPRE